MSEDATTTPATDGPASRSANWRFSLTMVSVCLMAFVASIGSSIATALPRISNELQAGENYVWIASIYMFGQTVIQPPCAQLCNIFGRKNPMIISLLVFATGSAVAGSSKTTSALIAGRTVQGLASGCIMMLSELIVCDLVPLRERGRYVGFVLTAIAFGTVVGPITSGALAEHHWRWVRTHLSHCYTADTS
jgi:MFS family permease